MFVDELGEDQILEVCYSKGGKCLLCHESRRYASQEGRRLLSSHPVQVQSYAQDSSLSFEPVLSTRGVTRSSPPTHTLVRHQMAPGLLHEMAPLLSPGSGADASLVRRVLSILRSVVGAMQSVTGTHAAGVKSLLTEVLAEWTPLLAAVLAPREVCGRLWG